MELFYQQLVNAFVISSVYALIAVGYNLIYGVLRFINFAHGNIMTIGAYTALFSLTFLYLPFQLAIILALLASALVALLSERVAYRPLREHNAPKLNLLITSVGVALLIENAIVVFFSADFFTFPAIFANTFVDLKFAKIIPVDLTIIAVSIALMIGLNWFVSKTKTGKAIRAISQDTDAAALMGIDTNRGIFWAFFISGIMAGTAGILVGLKFTVNPFMGQFFGLKAFIAAIIGGIGSIPGAYAGSFLIGFLEVFVAAYLSSNYRDAIAFLAMVIILLVRPSGLLGRAVKEKV